ncbi:MAG: phosphoenolpyruvate--protein phosphotransferase [Rhizobiales bacterium]|nr:phosphoenolpyruvate--protein phosphotransferase [Hyphomicrobiales bacterium]
MRSPVELRGKPASRGIFAGPVTRIAGEAAARVYSGSAAGERAALDAAIADAIAELTVLSEKIGGEGADMLAFQIAMLEDEALKAPAYSAIESAVVADKAWSAALAVEIAGYEASEDEYFRARAADLRDLRDRVLKHLSGTAGPSGSGGMILAGEDVPPTLFLETDWSRGGAIALTSGSASSHVAMLARARGVPMVVGLGAFELNGHDEAIVDGEGGILILSPERATVEMWKVRAAGLAIEQAREREFLHRPAVTADGVKVEVLVNVAGVEELDHIDIETCDGIGLMRTEFLFRDGAPLPDEDEQFAAYKRFLEWAKGKPVTIRTLDIGGDKPIRGLTPDGETNPFLGLRGVRLMLARRDVFRTQLRALARAAPYGQLKVMLPMVTIPVELTEAGEEFVDAADALKDEGIACGMPPLGIMVEVPAVAIVPEMFASAAFFSIGSNDLTQYVTASSRDSSAVAALNDPGNPAVIRLITRVARFGRENGIPVSLCGDMAGDPAHIGSLLKAGLRSLSVSPAGLARVKAAIANLRVGS